MSKIKKIVLSIAISLQIIFCQAQSLHNTTQYAIHITIKPYHEKCIYLGYYYGNQKGIIDSVCLNSKGEGMFTGADLLPGGVYFVIGPQKTILFDFLIDKQQRFSIDADTTGLRQNIHFSQSEDNRLFNEYTLFINTIAEKIKQTERTLSTTTNKQKKVAQKKLDGLHKQMDQYRENSIKQYPYSFLTVLLNALKDPLLPSNVGDMRKQQNKMEAFQYLKKHYWSNIDFTDGRLVRTPILENKLDQYFEKFVAPAADSIIHEIDWMLNVAQPDSTMYRFLIGKFIDQYMNTTVMGQDAVFVYLFQQHIAAGKVKWLTEEQRKYIYNRAYSVMANLIGRPAINIRLADTADHITSLYDIKAPYTLVCFWDPTCSHCTHLIPKLDSMYHKNWENIGLKIFAIMVDSDKVTWLKAIHEHGIEDWVNVYYTELLRIKESIAKQPTYRQLYDAFTIPTLVLLDADKNIIAKNLDYLQLNEFLQYRIREQKRVKD